MKILVIIFLLQSMVSIDINVEEEKGTMFLAVYDNAGDWMENAALTKKLKVKGGKVSFDLSLNPGTYAISVFQDLNGNGELDTNFVGVPTEPYGFSNDVMGKFGPPSFKKASVEVKTGDESFAITLK